MAVASPTTPFTPDDLLNLEDEGLFELVGGRLVEKEMSSVASKTTGIITGRLFIWSEDFKLGEVYPEQSFQCFPGDPKLVRRPDIAVILAERVAQVEPTGHVTIVPDLAIEVVSPNDKIYELDEKLSNYRSAGVKLIWVVNPASRNIRIYRLDHTVTELDETKTLTGEFVLTGFSVPVSAIFPRLPKS